eukprot:scaffold2911_cov414-Prasinococcus_capsulatus_cf.AAC.38
MGLVMSSNSQGSVRAHACIAKHRRAYSLGPAGYLPGRWCGRRTDSLYRTLPSGCPGVVEEPTVSDFDERRPLVLDRVPNLDAGTIEGNPFAVPTSKLFGCLPRPCDRRTWENWQ